MEERHSAQPRRKGGSQSRFDARRFPTQLISGVKKVSEGTAKSTAGTQGDSAATAATAATVKGGTRMKPATVASGHSDAEQAHANNADVQQAEAKKLKKLKKAKKKEAAKKGAAKSEPAKKDSAKKDVAGKDKAKKTKVKKQKQKTKKEKAKKKSKKALAQEQKAREAMAFHPSMLDESLVVATHAGKVAGVRFHGEQSLTPQWPVRTWRGVPYGNETSGPRRFAAPEPVDSWEGVRDCTQYRPPAAQPILGPTEKIKGTEDCLNLDIVRPDTDEVLPVVVYFHGGSFMMGSSHEQLLRGHALANAMNVVYVSLNFRLGPLGYLDVSSMAAAGETVSANPAILDQLLALKWVQHNIAAFGGDPDQVTIMGESAGGAAVLTLMCVPAAKGLFHGAIAQSPPIATVHSAAQGAFWVRNLRNRLGLHDDATVEDLRALPAADLVNAGRGMLWRSRELFLMNSCFGPTVDGKVLFEHPLEVFRKGEQHKVPLLLGTNYDEASFAKGMYLRQTARGKAAQRMLHAFDPQGTAAVLEAYEQAHTRGDFALLVADAVFWAPAMMAATYHQKHAPTWMYRFDFAPTVWRWLGLGAMHTMELTPVFGDLNASRAAAMNRIGTTKVLEDLRDTMQSLWAQFVHTGELPGVWPRYRVPAGPMPGRATMIFDRDARIINDPKSTKRRAWLQYTITQWGLGRPELLEELGYALDQTDHAQAPFALPPGSNE